MKLNWTEKKISGIPYWEAETPIGRFSLQFEPTNNIRGPWRLLIERKNEFVPMDVRHYHDIDNAKEEASFIAAAVTVTEGLV